MPMKPGLRKAALTIHVSCSVGWLGAVAAFLALAITGVVSASSDVVRGAYLAMAIIGWFVIVPLSLGSLASGVVQALGTPWGLFHHYWIVLKALIALLASALLLAHMLPTTTLAQASLHDTLSDPGLASLRIRLLANAAAASFVLTVAVTLGVFKPKGRIGEGIPRWLKAAAVPAVVLVTAFGLLHRLV